MAKLTRRGLIKRASMSAGAVTVLAAGAIAAETHFGSDATTNAQAAAPSTTASGDSIVVCVTNPAAGTLVVMRGEQETTVTNLNLVNTLLAL